MTYSPLIKICGLKTAEMLDVAIEAGADMVGFVHFPRSPRHAEIDTIGELISRARGSVECVVLLVNPDNSLVAEIASLDPDWIQLHGPENPHRVEAIRAEGGVPIIKAVGIGENADLARALQYEAVCDRLLLDAKAPKTSEVPGGRGVRFDWSLLSGLDQDIEYILSGGLTPQNVADAIDQVQPLGLDVSSGVEKEPGEKDAAKIRAFVQNARQAANAFA